MKAEVPCFKYSLIFVAMKSLIKSTEECRKYLSVSGKIALVNFYMLVISISNSNAFNKGKEGIGEKKAAWSNGINKVGKVEKLGKVLEL